MESSLDFGNALRALRRGEKVARDGWNGKDMWIRYVDLYSDKEFRVLERGSCKGTWMPFLAMKTADNKLIPWLASQTDMQAEDWRIVS